MKGVETAWEKLPPQLSTVPEEDGDFSPLKNRSVLTYVNFGDFEQLRGFIANGEVKNFAVHFKQAFWKQLLKYEDLSRIEEITAAIFDKILTYESETQGLPLADDVIYIKAKTLNVKVNNNLNIIGESKNLLSMPSAKQMAGEIGFACSAYKLLLNTASEQDSKYIQILVQESEEAQNILNRLIETMDSIKNQFDLLEIALTSMQTNKLSDIQLVDLYIKLGSYGTKIQIPEILVKVINYNLEVYNIIYQTQLDKDSAKKLCKVLNNLKDIFAEIGDERKAILFQKKIDSLESQFNLSQQEEKGDEEVQVPSIKYTPILVSGKISAEILEIKKHIQENVLNKIQEAASNGKWINMQYLGNYGVSGYIEENWLKKQLGQFSDENSYNIALSLCFEAINIGIMNSKEQNYTCAVIFCQEYPKIAENIYKNHPEYFVDWQNIRASYSDGKPLIDEKLENIEHGYNKFFEESMKPIIAKRIQVKILNEIETILKTAWTEINRATLTELANSAFIQKVLGNNLSKIADVEKIVQIMIFKKITEMVADGSLVPATDFIDNHPELLKRISEDNKDLLANKAISEYLDQAIQKSLVIVENNGEEAQEFGDGHQEQPVDLVGDAGNSAQDVN